LANDIKLQEGQTPVDQNLRPLKVGGKATAIEIAQHGNGAKINGDLNVTKTLSGDFNGTIKGDLAINIGNKLYIDGGDDTYIREGSYAANSIQFVCGDTLLLQLFYTAIGQYAKFTSAVGFDQLEPTYDATNTVVTFDFGNKQFLTFGSGNITNMKLNFPSVSGNFVLLLKQDGTGSRTVTNWLAYDMGGSVAAGSSTVKWSGGSAPTLTTDANHVDILSFYWDADNEIAYGVPTLDFQF